MDHTPDDQTASRKKKNYSGEEKKKSNLHPTPKSGSIKNLS
jgi:hypothetical protein